MSTFIEIYIGRVNNFINSSSIISTTTWVTWFFNRNIFILWYSNIIFNWSRYTNQLFIWNGVWNIVMSYSLVSCSLNWSSDNLICSLHWGRWLDLNLNSLLINSWSNNSLFVVSISSYINSLISTSLLNNWLSGNWISINNFVRSIYKLNLNIFFLFNWLDISLSDILVSW